MDVDQARADAAADVVLGECHDMAADLTHKVRTCGALSLRRQTNGSENRSNAHQHRRSQVARLKGDGRRLSAVAGDLAAARVMLQVRAPRTTSRLPVSCASAAAHCFASGFCQELEDIEDAACDEDMCLLADLEEY